MRIAVEGCAHGELEKIYQEIEVHESKNDKKVDLLICCGDFQATRNLKDLRCMAVPDKYKSMCSFYKYYSGEKIAPVLTIIIGGNHEASNYMQELPYGGWVAPNMYYLGYAGVVNVGGLRIAGISGIYKGRDFMQGHHEFPPYNNNTIRSAYHIRNLEIFRLKQLSGKVDIFLSHDWPQGITQYGDVNALLRKKPFFRDDIENDCLGSAPAMELLKHHYPSHWFAAHLHCKFTATVQNGDKSKSTNFLALDKCLPKRQFLQIMEIEHDTALPIKISYDLEWLTILYLTNHLLSIKNSRCYMPGPGSTERVNFTPSEEEKVKINYRFDNDLCVPLNFIKTVEPYQYGSPNKRMNQPDLEINNQTTEFCTKLGVDDPFTLIKLKNASNERSQDSKDTSISSLNSSLLSNSYLSMSSFSTDVSISTEEDENRLFYFDTNPSPNPIIKTPMKLPAAKNETSALDDSDSVILLNSPKSSRSFEEAENEAKEVCTKSEPEPNKKFKRRNQALYTETD